MPAHRAPALKDNLPLGVGTIIATVLALSLGDALIKAMGGAGAMGLWQLFFLRSILAFPVLLIGALAVFGSARLRPRRLTWSLIRAGLLAAMWVFYYAALPHLPFAVAATAYYTLPLFVVIFAALFGGEAVGRSQWAAVALGFAGIVAVLRPGGEAFQWVALLPILSAVLYAAAMILTRTHCREDHPATLALTLNGVFIAVGAAGLILGPLLLPTDAGFLSAEWTIMTGAAWQVIALLAALILLASVGTAIAYQVAPASVVGTFDFAYVGFALIWGLVFFAERPDAPAMIGMVMIVGAGVLAVRRPPPA